MSKKLLKIDVVQWVERAKADPVTYQQRQAIEVTLNTIAMANNFNKSLVLKGGILMGIVYDSPRQTADIDLSAQLPASDYVDEQIRTLLDTKFPVASAKLGYADLIMRTQSIKRQPKKSIFATAKYPALKIKIGFAKRNSKQEVALKKGKSPNVIDLDISFNESLQQVQILKLTGGEELLAYSLSDLIAEKYRAMLQQVIRDRNRRQDVYDIHLLIKNELIDDSQHIAILESFLMKCRSRRIEPNIDSLDSMEIKSRSFAEWETMKLEIGDVPEFDKCYELVKKFYRNLPWK